MIILDTHALIWLTSASDRLGERARSAIDEEWARERVAASSISFWETAMLVGKRRISVSQPLAEWRKTLLSSGLIEIVIDGGIAISAGNLENFHGDPADRFIVATTIRDNSRLVTADGQILQYLGSSRTIDALT